MNAEIEKVERSIRDTKARLKRASQDEKGEISLRKVELE